MSFCQNHEYLHPLAKLNMLVILFFGFIGILWASMTGFYFNASTEIPLLIVVIGFLYLASVLINFKLTRNIANSLLWMSILLVGMTIAGFSSYLLATLNLPLVDSALLTMDRAIGFDWVAYVTFFTNHPSLLHILEKFYNITVTINLCVVLYLGLTGKHKLLEIYVTTLLISLIIIISLSGLLPAVGLYEYHKLQPINGFTPVIFDKTSPAYFLEAFQTLRDGSLTYFSQYEMTGIVTFPSFHAVLAFINVFAFRDNKWLYPVAVVTFLIILVSTPIIGGHYLIDVIAGLAVTWMSWHAALKVREYVLNKEALPTFSFPYATA